MHFPAALESVACGDRPAEGGNYLTGYLNLSVSYLDDSLMSRLAAHLPIQLTCFVGRETELTQLAGLVRTSRLVTITGAAGLGKTRLAVELAWHTHGAVDAEAWFTSLAESS